MVSTVIGSGWDQRALAIGLAMHDLALVPDQQHRAWDAILLDRLLDGLIEQAATRRTFARTHAARPPAAAQIKSLISSTL
jgi:hypothetical protein